MARKRMLDPKIWESEQVMSLHSDAFKIYVYLILHADDEGRLVVSYPMITSRCFPISNGIDADSVETHIGDMADSGLICLYSDDTSTYLQHPNWHSYQTINRPTPSTIPCYEPSMSAHGVVTPKLIEVKLKEVKISVRDDSVKHGEHVKLVPEVYEKLCFQYGKSEVDSKIVDINDYCSSTGKRYKDYAATIRQWFKRDKVFPKANDFKTCDKGHRYKGQYCEMCI